MIEYKTGNLFEDDAEAVVNTVNCVGVMGRGIALQCKKLYPANFKAYEQACKKGDIMPGKMFVTETGNLSSPKYIINFPTKRHWRFPSRIEDIESGMQALIYLIRDMRISSVAIPPLGCGNGGLDWNDVFPLLVKYLDQLPDVQIHLYAPNVAPRSVVVTQQAIPNMTLGRAALICLMKDYLDGLLVPFISLLEIHKLMYFLQEAGQPLRLQYVKYTYGPYATNLRQVLNRMEGYYTKGYEDGGDNPRKQLEIMPGALEKAQLLLKDKTELHARIERVVRLIDGFEAPDGMELLSTVHWTVVKEHVTTFHDIVQYIYRWNAHKRKFTEYQIKQAYDRLAHYGWLIS
jgi:O-acetyl-ADP-ribose deacetylase (regulator of RNase III)